MSERFRSLMTALAGVAVSATLAGAQANPPDRYLCYAAGAGKTKRQAPISRQRVEIEDRLGGPERFKLRRLSALCNPAGVNGTAIAHESIHLEGLNIKADKGAPKFVGSTLTVTDAFATRALFISAPASLLDVTPAQPGNTVPPDFTDDPTTSATEVNRFKCYTVKAPKGAPKFVPPASPIVVDEQFTGGQSFVVKKVSKLCLPADVDGATPGAPLRDTLLVCYAIKLPKGDKFARATFGTHTRTIGGRIVGRRKPAELCVLAR